MIVFLKLSKFKISIKLFNLIEVKKNSIVFDKFYCGEKFLLSFLKLSQFEIFNLILFIFLENMKKKKSFCHS